MSKIDFARYPHITQGARQMIREFEYQTTNPNLNAADQAWFQALITLMCDHLLSVEDAISRARVEGYRYPAFKGDEMGRPSDD